MSEAGFDTLLAGRVRHRQRAHGHRSGIEPVLLAAFVPARPGERVLEGGTGSGAGLLCVAARVPCITGCAIELDPELASLAAENFALNDCPGLQVLQGDLTRIMPQGVFDHAMANPPWHDAAATQSPDPGRALARKAPADLFTLWAQSLARHLRHRGTLSIIVGAGAVSACLAAFTEAGCGSHVIFPLWPRPGRPAKLVLLQAVRGGRGPTRMEPGLVLHAEGSAYTSAAEDVLRGAQPLRPRTFPSGGPVPGETS